MTAGRIVIIGGGHNGLTAAFYLARAGFRPVVVERLAVVGGAAVTGSIGGLECPTLAHATGPLRPAVVRDMALERRGVRFAAPDPALVSLAPEGPPLVLFRDHGRTAEAMAARWPQDAARYPVFCGSLARLGGFLRPLLERTPPSFAGRLRDVRDLLLAARRLRQLPREDGYRLLRWLPMPVADVAAEAFDGPLMQAVIAARGIFGTAAGPRSAGTAAVMLMQAALDPAPGGSSVMVRGGPGALTRAMAEAARDAGAEIRTGAAAARVLIEDGAAAGVALEGGEELRGAAVVSGVDPRRTFLDLVEPGALEPVFLARMRSYRARGTMAKVNLALGALPGFREVKAPALLAGRIQIGPDIDYLERAFDASKYGGIPEAPYLDITIPTLADGAGPAGGRHVMSVCAQFAPYRLAPGRTWEIERDVLADRVMAVLERHAPGIRQLVEQREVITPADLEQGWGLTGGQIFHGEPSLDQLFLMRPALGWAEYRTPVRGLFLCGAGTHPGGGITGGPGQNAAREIARALGRGLRRAR